MPAITALDRAADPVVTEAASLVLTGIAVNARARGGAAATILDVPSLTIPPASTLAVAGPSGAGKTTLLHLIAGLLPPARGEIRFGRQNVGALSDTARDRWRRHTVGMVFQDFALVPELDMLGNVLLPASFDKRNLRETKPGLNPKRPRSKTAR